MNRQAAKVLVVEDALNWREYMQAKLKSLGYQVNVAANLQEGLSMLREGPFEFAVVDIRLEESNKEDVSGITLIKEAWSRHSVAAFIVLSAFLVREKVENELGREIPYQILDKAVLVTQHFEDTLKSISLSGKKC